MLWMHRGEQNRWWEGTGGGLHSHDQFDADEDMTNSHTQPYMITNCNKCNRGKV